MIFAINSKEPISIPKATPFTLGGYATEQKKEYTFPKAVALSELDAYYFFRKKYILKEFYKKSQNQPINPHSIAETIPVFVIPKVYNYYPFLDCDTSEQYHNCCALLFRDNINFVSYKSSPAKDSYWIFCDNEGSFEDSLKFMQTYPADPRYAWVASYKHEFCVRAIPKSGLVP